MFLPNTLMATICTSRLLSVLLDILGRKAVFVLVTQSGQCLTCTFRASCCSAHLSWAQVPAFAGSSVWNRKKRGTGCTGGYKRVQAVRPKSVAGGGFGLVTDENTGFIDCYPYTAHSKHLCACHAGWMSPTRIIPACMGGGKFLKWWIWSERNYY